MTSRERKLLMVGLGVLIAVLLVGRVATPLYRTTGRSLANYHAQWELLAETEALLASLPALEDSARELRGSVAGLAPRILNGHSPAEAIADLSTHLYLLANRQSSKLEAVRALPDTEASTGLCRVGVVVTLHTDANGLAAWLGAIATHPVALVARSIRIGASGGFASRSEMESLLIELTVSGWYLARAANN